MVGSISLITKYIGHYDYCNHSASLPDFYVRHRDCTLDISLHIFSPSFFCFFSMMFDVRLDVNDWVSGQSLQGKWNTGHGFMEIDIE